MNGQMKRDITLPIQPAGDSLIQYQYLVVVVGFCCHAHANPMVTETEKTLGFSSVGRNRHGEAIHKYLLMRRDPLRIALGIAPSHRETISPKRSQSRSRVES